VALETGLKHLFVWGVGVLNWRILSGPNLGISLYMNARKRSPGLGFAIVLAPFAFVISPRQVKQKLSLRGVWNIVLDLVFLEVPGDASGFRDELANISAVGIEDFLFAHEHIFQLKAIGLPKCLIENRLGNFETDEIVVVSGA